MKGVETPSPPYGRLRGFVNARNVIRHQDRPSYGAKT